MNKEVIGSFLTKQIPVYKVWLGFLGLLLFLIMVGTIISPPSRTRTKARILATRSEIKALTLLLNEYGKLNGRLPVGENAAVMTALSVTFTNANFQFASARTNLSGEIVDFWQVPLRIQIEASTNFVICSAGPNKKLGDKDDIVFNSVSNDFVKP